MLSLRNRGIFEKSLAVFEKSAYLVLIATQAYSEVLSLLNFILLWTEKNLGLHSHELLILLKKSMCVTYVLILLRDQEWWVRFI